jgi:sialate O-acetylesterase
MKSTRIIDPASDSPRGRRASLLGAGRERFERTASKVPILAAAAIVLVAAPNSGAQPAAPAENIPKLLPFVSPIFGDNMVMQRGKANTLWGWSDPGDTVRVEIGGNAASGVAGADRRWQVKIQLPAAGGPYTVKIAGSGSNEFIELHNVLVGDVWLCSGQSNMGLPLFAVRNAEAEIKAANYPEMRYFTVADRVAYRPTDMVAGSWNAVSPDTAARLSAAAYFFARKVQNEIHVPIGLVIDAVGGSPAEAWTGADALRPLHDFDVPLAQLEQLAVSNAPEYGNYIMHWYDQYDIGLKQNWYAAGLDDSSWKTVQLPGGFAELGVPQTPAVAWFRKEIDLPNPLPAGRATLFLGSIERMDTVYVNGTWVGASAWVENPRAYLLPEGVLKPGKNLVAIRVFKTKPDGGFLGKPGELRLELGDYSSVPLAGDWKGKLSLDARPPQPMPISFENWPIMPTVLYEGMLKPIAPLSIAGALWYQGEQNSPRGYQYRKLLPATIADWRKLFGQGDFPFYIVGLPAFSPRSPIPVDGDEWAETRESQAIAAATVPNSCLAVTIDTGDANNLHPKDKQPVGERLADCALAKYYGKNVAYSGPVLASVERLPGAIRLHFTHTDGGLVVKGDKLGEFSIAGDDRKWVWADARIEGDTVLVSSPQVSDPKEVRYAWQSNPEATLFNGAGLPAAPFRTDTWPGKTQDARPY